MNKELRYIRADLRADTDTRTIFGYAAKYNVISNDLGGFREVLLPGCFDLENSPDIICNREHDDVKMLGRTISGTLEVGTDDIGMWFRATPPDTTDGRDAVVLIARGDLQDCSFCFYTSEDGSDEEWSVDEDGPIRRVKHATVGDVSIVAHPAYPNTEVALRSLARVQETKAPEYDPYEHELLKLKLWLMENS